MRRNVILFAAGTGTGLAKDRYIPPPTLGPAQSLTTEDGQDILTEDGHQITTE